MDRREVLGVFGVAAAGLAAGAGARAQERQPDKKGRGGHEQMAKQTGKTCSDCADECDAGFHHCHEQLAAGKKQYAQAEHLCVDTATVCHAAASLCGRVSPLMGFCCQACAECCEECIRECEKLSDPELKRVVEECRRTAKVCRQMAQMTGGTKKEGGR